MTVTERVLTSTLKRVTRIICRVDDAEIARIPHSGPLILVANHVNFLEVPLLYTHLRPRPITGFAKIETWDNPAMGWLFNVLQAIPIRRGQADTAAFRRALQVLQAGSLLGVAPEGTRSNDGRLGRGHPGIVLLALRSGAPIMPLAYFGGEEFHRNIWRLQRTNFHIRVGNQFYLDAQGEKVTREVRRKMTAEIMYQLAAILPARYRGHYANLRAATDDYLRFPPGSENNLGRAEVGPSGALAFPAMG